MEAMEKSVLSSCDWIARRQIEYALMPNPADSSRLLAQLEFMYLFDCLFVWLHVVHLHAAKEAMLSDWQGRRVTLDKAVNDPLRVAATFTDRRWSQNRPFFPLSGVDEKEARGLWICSQQYIMFLRIISAWSIFLPRRMCSCSPMNNSLRRDICSVQHLTACFLEVGR